VQQQQDAAREAAAGGVLGLGGLRKLGNKFEF
jgi:hypothetical protein